MKHRGTEAGDTVVGHGVADGYLSSEDIARLAREGLARLPLDGRRVLVLIPDGTRTMPMPLMFETLERELGERVAALDFLVALGTHTPMTDAQLSRHVGQAVVDGKAGQTPDLQPPVGRSRHLRQAWRDSRRPTFAISPGDASTSRYRSRSTGCSSSTDHVLICGPVFPHEVVGFSGGTKYLFPGRRRRRHHPLHPLAGRADHELRRDRHDGHAGPRGDRSRGESPLYAALAAGAGRDP